MSRVSRSSAWPVLLGVLMLAKATAAAPQANEERPWVEIIDSTGAVDGPDVSPSDRPFWDRVRLELRIKNRLPKRITRLETELVMLHAASGRNRPIPGWTFRIDFGEEVVAAQSERNLTIERSLPTRRSFPRGDHITYRLRILSYRIHSPDLRTAIELLASPQHADQRAARLSFEDPQHLSIGEVAQIRDEIAEIFDGDGREPSASDALKLFLAAHAVGSIRLAELLTTMLTVPDRFDRSRWGQAVKELALRMIAASAPADPRLQILPPWAREESALIAVRADDAVEEAVKSTVYRMGDDAVPALIRQAKLAPSAAARRRAQRLLAGLGRATIRSQLQIRDTKTKVQVIRTLGRLDDDAPVVPLAELLGTKNDVVGLEVSRALEDLGPRATSEIIDAVGHIRHKRLHLLLNRFGRRWPNIVRRQAHARCVQLNGRGELSLEQWLKPLIDHRRQVVYRARKRAVQRALAAGRAGRFARAFAFLDKMFVEDRALYMQHAPEIGRLYGDRARLLLAGGNFDAAVRTAKTGLSVFAEPELEALLDEAQRALVYGFIELNDLQQAEEVFAKLSTSRRRDELTGELWAARDRRAYANRRYDVARAFVDRVRAKGLQVEVLGVHRRLLIVENYAIILVLSLLLPAAVIAAAFGVRRYWQSARLRRLVRQLDEKTDQAAKIN
ncbi:MAG: hypothetical protein AAF449_02450 [Myxococcota bacterium]